MPMRKKARLGRHGEFTWAILIFLAACLGRAAAQLYQFTTVAGSTGQSGNSDGANSQALFSSPFGLAVAQTGEVYVADEINCAIRKLSRQGTNWVVTTIAGHAESFSSIDGTNGDATFGIPTGVAVDNRGVVYAVDHYGSTIRKLVLEGTNWVVTTIAGLSGKAGTTDGTNSAARFAGPGSVAVDAGGNLYVSDTDNCAIRKLTLIGTNWVVSTIAGLATGGAPGAYTDGIGSEARFSWPWHIAIDKSTNLYVANTFNAVIRKVSPAGRSWVVTTLAGLGGVSGSMDGTNHDARFASPIGVAVSQDGAVFVCDSRNSLIRKLTPVGTNWIVTTVGGVAGASGSADGIGIMARFGEPYGIAVDREGALLVGDVLNQTLRRGEPLAVAALPPVWLKATLTANALMLDWDAVAGVTYQLQVQTNLDLNSWMNWGGVITATNDAGVAFDAIGPDRQRSYRIEVGP